MIYTGPPNNFVKVNVMLIIQKKTSIGTKSNVVCAEKPFQNEEELCVRLSGQKMATTTDERLINSYGECERMGNVRKQTKKEREDSFKTCTVLYMLRAIFNLVGQCVLF